MFYASEKRLTMKKIKQIISILLISALIISCFGIQSSASDNSGTTFSILSEKNIVSASKMINFLQPALRIYELIFGKSFIEIDFNDSYALELCNYISENSELDIVDLLNKIPIKANALELYYKITDADTTAIRNSIYALRDDADKQNNKNLSLALFIFGAYISVIETAEVYTIPYGDDGSQRVVLKVYYLDGNSDSIETDIYFTSDGYAYGPDGAGIQLLGFECSVYDLMIYASVNCWMRDFGFCFIYDLFSYITPFYNYITRRYKFEYDGKEWMIQAWKGNYLFTNGAEVGIYNRNKGSIGTFYNCYDSEMNMALKLSCGDEIIYNIQKEHWWINGFKLSEDLYSPEDMTIEFSIEFPSAEMAEAFAESVNNQYRNDSSCIINHCRATVVW